MPIQIEVGTGSPGASLKDYATLIAASLAFVGALIGFVVNGYLQRVTDRRKFQLELASGKLALTQRKEVARVTLYAQLFRMYKTTLRQRGYIERSEIKFMWITLFRDALPSASNVSRMELLTPKEVIELTSFFHSYQEHISFIIANSQVNAGDQKKVEIGIIGYDYSDPKKQGWLLWSLNAIERKLQSAKTAIVEAVANEYPANAQIALVLAAREEPWPAENSLSAATSVAQT